MKRPIDAGHRTLTPFSGGKKGVLPAWATAACEARFAVVANVAYHGTHPFSLSWLDRPTFQPPEDPIRAHEVILRGRRDALIESIPSDGCPSIPAPATAGYPLLSKGS